MDGLSQLFSCRFFFLVILLLKFLILRDVIIEVAQILFSKKVPFCIYRFPEEQKLRIALGEGLLPHPGKKDFWVAPFCESSQAKDIHLSVLEEIFVNKDFLNKLKGLSPRDFKNIPLPDETSKPDYLRAINSYLNDIHSGELKKAVLSRVLKIKKPKQFNVVKCFLRLEASYPKAFVYLLLHSDSGIWMGATPELLFRKERKEISIMALAGTQAKRASGHYRWREKEKEEHSMVGKHIESIFQKHKYRILKKSGPKTIESAQVAHLRTDYIFEEREKVSMRQLLKDLHPTPAVGGLPKDKGLACILSHENYDRRYYTGFLGETDSSDSVDLYVNLRCMQIGEDEIAVYAGGGITAASNPEEEWQETFLKSKTMTDKIETDSEGI